MCTKSINSHCSQLQALVLLDKYNCLMLLYMPQGIQEIHTELDEMALYQEKPSSSLSSIRVQAWFPKLISLKALDHAHAGCYWLSHLTQAPGATRDAWLQPRFQKGLFEVIHHICQPLAGVLNALPHLKWQLVRTHGQQISLYSPFVVIPITSDASIAIYWVYRDSRWWADTGISCRHLHLVRWETPQGKYFFTLQVFFSWGMLFFLYKTKKKRWFLHGWFKL